ncbi:MAG: DUF4149 domain-containing protein [Gemmatimonadaceae bacterium]|nr:DUF4149 domain-containing protein [Gemmatimonadaceae bacterium]NUQ91640.1 DUF4149 domain-containing protein [Gemmatimonadaceae bacterium]NUR18369.1 DUF4149 domain-containing protein [Gemmatimonadaceae bacterium]NUS98835.1 DUF4149 domain-containing protein [Gemmatimonadaceae bacterium]
MTSPRASRALRATELALAAAWIGAGILFAAVLAPAAFAVLPTRTLAGALVGRVLPALFWWGIATGVVLAILAMRSRGRLVTVGTVAGLVTAVSCAVGQLVVAPRIERVRASIPGAVDDLPPADSRRVEFGRLHGASVLWLGVGMLAAAVGAGSAVAGIRRD